MSTKNNKQRRTWAEVVLQALRKSKGGVHLSSLYEYVEAQAPELIAKNSHWRDKVRQVVQRLRDQGLAEQLGQGIWSATLSTAGAVDKQKGVAPSL